MRSELLPSEHVFALFVNLIVIVAAGSSLFHLLPVFFSQRAKLDIMNEEVQEAQQQVHNLEAMVQAARSHPHNTARSQANLVPNSRISILWSNQ